MIEETDMSQEKKWFFEEQAKNVLTNLRKRNFNAHYFPHRHEALSAILSMIPEGAVVARADSVSLDQVGIIMELKKRDQNAIIYSMQRDQNGHYLFDHDKRITMEKESFHADIFLSGINAITMDGKLVNTDGHGNRVSAMIFGPAKVILVAGVNKIVKNIDEAMERIHRICAPLNAKRHYVKHGVEDFSNLPCVKTGQCSDCRSEWRICCYTVIMEGAMQSDKDRINVVLVGEELGL